MWNSYFPGDVMLLILIRLPARSLVRFKTVSKSWNAQISSPKFIKLHLNQFQMKPDMLLYDFDSGKPASLKILLLEFSSDEENIVGNICRLNNPFKSLGLLGQPFIIGGPCNSLLCLSSGRGYTLYNPLTKSFLHLPLRTGSNNNLRFYGFGYDDIHDDYKLIMLYRSLKSRIEHECEIYSLRSNSWTSIGLQLEGEVQQRNHGGVLFNCSLHWVFGSSILAFDLREEKLTFLSAPYKVLEEHDLLQLSVLNGCLLLRTYKNISCNMWLMKDCGVKDSWIKLTTHLTSEILWFLTPVVLLEGKRKMVLYDMGKMLLYDLVKDEVVESTNIQECEYFVMPRQHEFVASLVDPLRLWKPSYSSRKCQFCSIL